MNQDYVRPKSPLSLSPSPPPLLRVDGGAQSTRWSLTVRYLTAKGERRREASARARGYIYRQYIRPISAPLSVLFLLTRPAPLLTLVRRRREREKEPLHFDEAKPSDPIVSGQGSLLIPLCDTCELSDARCNGSDMNFLWLEGARPSPSSPFGKWQVVHCLSLLPILQ